MPTKSWFSPKVTALVLKVFAAVFGLIPLGFIGIFHLFGGADPGSGGEVRDRILFCISGVPYCLLTVFWAIPNRVFLRWRLHAFLAFILCALSIALAVPFLVWLHRSDPSASLVGSVVSGLLIVLGLLCAPASYYFAWKANHGFPPGQSNAGKNKWVV